MSSSTPPLQTPISSSAGNPASSSALTLTAASNGGPPAVPATVGNANVDREQVRVDLSTQTGYNRIIFVILVPFQIYQWILELSSPNSRETALLELSKKREVVPDLAPMLWHSFGTISALLQEIINIYPAINPPNLSAHQSNRVCNALALLQCVASHPDTRSLFLLAHIPLYLYPFLHTVSKTRPFEYLRLTSLGVIGALVKTDEQEVGKPLIVKKNVF